MELDLTTFAGVAAGATAVIGLAKKFLPSLMKGKEAFVALLLPMAFMLISKALGNFVALSWVGAPIVGLALGISAQLLHDYGTNPTLKKWGPKVIGIVMALFKKKVKDATGKDLPEKKEG